MLGPVPVAVAWLILAVAAAHPPHGLPLPACVLRASTGVQCPGCGLTRSLSCAARGMLGESVAYHPMGPAVLAVMAAVAATGAAPARARRRLMIAVGRRARLADLLYCGFVAAFVAAGLVRTVASW